MSKVAAIIVAGGSGKRMGMKTKKQFIQLKGKEILAHTIEAFNEASIINEIVVVVSEEDVQWVQEEIVKRYDYNKVVKVVCGGKERQDSVYNGLQVITKEVSYIMVHDGARPFIKEAILEKALQETMRCEATVVAVPVKDTVKVIDENKEVISTPDRNTLWAVQTPQTFKRALLIEAYEAAKSKNLQVTDDSMIVEAYGQAVHVVEGDYTNIKVTTPEDLVIGEVILNQSLRSVTR